MGEALTWHGHQAKMICEKCGKYVRNMNVTPPQYLRIALLNQLAWVTRAPGGEQGLKDLRRRERRAAARAAIEIGDTTEKAVNVNETTPESVEETVPAENAENNEKSGNTIRFSEISFSTLAVEKLMRLKLPKLSRLTLIKKKSLIVISATAQIL